MKILITGGAGFIGSHLANHLLQLEHVSLVRVMDNLTTGSLKILRNLRAFLSLNLYRAT
jgi:nucleoside-diphosphate-sugar epimerase